MLWVFFGSGNRLKIDIYGTFQYKYDLNLRYNESFIQLRFYAAIKRISELLKMDRIFSNFPCWDFLRVLICYNRCIPETKTVEIPPVAISGRLTDFFFLMTGLMIPFYPYNLDCRPQCSLTLTIDRYVDTPINTFVCKNVTSLIPILKCPPSIAIAM